MSSAAIIMMVLFMVVIWGGLAVSLLTLNRHPDETSGILGEHEFATDEVLIAQEIRQED
ncbi:methionine/alanine import NSS transporter subunit MetS [Corynebacterium pseudopelargi]|uniref:Methionine/alanine importer small subunit n=1 Tax=Corynebacterium pseudopelargi TaxID=2080757 RepID=A0A3G6J0B2_9CORY|nr:methionine/alanine import NSS transporter subunit MetS [Corynebacterium pseudopelargi]AZA09584.1 hypothetical protein CPPEL_07370 [Corynebacterium pseudopelargi]